MRKCYKVLPLSVNCTIGKAVLRKGNDDKSSFVDRVLAVVSDIPRGETKTYGEVAVLAGSPNAARAVGSILRKNYRQDVPCHRVIRSDGSPGQYNRGGAEKKRRILQEEGWRW